MYLEQRFNYFNPPQFNLGVTSNLANVLGTTQRWSIDRTWPIEEILVYINFDTTALTTAAATTNDTYDNIAQILQRVNLTVNDGRQPRSVVDCSGAALLEYSWCVGKQIDESTLNAIGMAYSQSGAGATANIPAGTFTMCYRIPCAPPQVAEPLRTRLYLPVHTYPQDPVLTLQFNTLSGMGLSVGTIGNTAFNVEVQLIRRVPTKDSEALLQSTKGSNPNGYIDWDLIETPFTVPLNTSSEQRFPLPVPGNYMDLMFRQYLGGTNISRIKTIDNLDSSTTANLGLETRWRLETGLVVLREWRWKHLRTINDYSRPVVPVAITAGSTPPNGAWVALTSGGSPTTELLQYKNILPVNFPIASQATVATFRAGTTTYIDFLGNGVTPDSGNELGSLLDCNTPANNGLKMELIGTPASASSNASTIAVMGRRLFGDISRWQKF